MELAVSPGIALATAAGIALLATLLGTLTHRGGLAATAIGAVVLMGTGWPGGLMLVTFFLTSTGISRLSPGPEPVPDLVEDTRRTARQVLANGGAAGLSACIAAWHPVLGMWMLTAGVAAAAADTWATEVGQRRGTSPRNLITGETVAPGTSGGVTVAGTMAGVLGAGTIAAVASVVSGMPVLPLLLTGTLVGTFGMLTDSVLGAAWQASFLCRACSARCESARHRCGARAELQKGVRWLDNDWVNALSTTLATAAGALAYWLVASCC
jgi:uncharacterized protein (TIGR00297 family)